MLKRREVFDERVPVDKEELKRLSTDIANAEAKEFCSSLGLETPEQMKKWCIEKMKHSRILSRVKI